MLKNFLVFCLIFLGGCTCQTGTGDEDDMKSIIGAQLSEMSRTANAGSAAAGLPSGVTVRGLMQTELEPGEYTIQFSVIPPSDGLGFAAYAIVNWKVAGHQLRRVVSVASGAVISGVADAVDVQIVDVSGASLGGSPPLYPPLANGNPDPRQLYKVASTLSRGSRPSLNQPGVLVTQPKAIAIGSGGSQDFNVPQDCGVISVYVFSALPIAPDVPANIIAQQRDAAGNPLGNFSPAGQPGWIPLITGATTVHVVNGGTVAVATNVLWGVDG